MFGVRPLRALVRRPRYRRLARPEEQKHATGVENDDAGHSLPVGGLEREGRVRTKGLGDAFGESLDLWCSGGPHDLNEAEKRLADGRAQADGQSASDTTATSRPATAPATPLRAASFWKMRETKDWDSDAFCMVLNLG